MRASDRAQRERRRSPAAEGTPSAGGGEASAPFSAWAQAQLGNGQVLASLRGEGSALGGAIVSRMASEAAGLGAEGGPPDNGTMLAMMRAAKDAEADSSVQALLERSSGGPLPAAIAAKMGAALGHDLSHVKIHTDGAASEAADALQAHAFAIGADVYFGTGEYAPGSPAGDELLLHELQHVVQHDEGRLPQDGGVSSPSDPAEREATAVAHQALSGLQSGSVDAESAPSSAVAGGGAGQDAPVHRSALGDAVGAVTDAVTGAAASGLVEAVRVVSPELADLLQGGIGSFAEEALGDALEAFVAELLDGFDPLALVGGLVDEIKALFATIDGVLAGDPCCCETFAGWMETLSGLLTSLNDNPLAVALRDGVSAFGGLVNDVLALLVGADLKVLLAGFSGAKALFDGYLAVMTAGQDAVKGLADWVWDGVCSALGIDATDGNIVDVVLDKAQAWLLDSVSSEGPGLFDALKSVSEFAWKLNPLNWAYQLLGVFEALWEAGSFLWANWGAPTMAEDAAKTSAMAQTFIAAFDIAATATGAVSTEMGELFDAMLAQSEANADAVGMGWMVRGAQALLSVLQLPAELGIEFATWLMDGGTATIAGWASAAWDYFHPLMEVMSSLTLAFANPPMIPLILAGWAWRALPDCLKPPIVDLLLDVVIDALQAMPELPGLLELGHVLQMGLVGALGAFRSRSDEDKITITNRVAELLTGSPDFVLGFVVGVFGGMLDGVLDPLMLIGMVIEGVIWLVDSAGGLLDGALGGGEAASGEAPADAATGMADQAITLDPVEAAAGSAGLAPTGGAAVDPLSDPDVAAVLAGASATVVPPAQVVGETFVPAFEEVFSGEGKSSVSDLAGMVGGLWDKMLSLAEEAGAWLGEQLCEAMLSADVGYDLGYGVGYVTGAILWEVILGFLTGGLWEALGPTSRAIVKFLDLGGELFGAAFELLGELGSMLWKAAGPLLEFLGDTGLMKTLRGALQELSQALISLSDELVAAFGAAEGAAAGAAKKAEGLADEGAGLVDGGVGLADEGVGLADEAAGLGDEAGEGVGAARRAVIAGDDAKLALAAQRIRGEPGVFDVVVHGDGSSLLVLEGGAWKELSPAELAEHMKANGFEGGSVRLVSCGTGSADGAAADLARELGVEVKAPTDTVWIHPDGTLTVGPTPDAPSGGWSRTTPSGESEVVEGSAQLGDEALEGADDAVSVGKRSTGTRYPTPESEALGVDIERAISELGPDQTRELGWYKARQRALDGIERQGPEELFETEREQMLSALRNEVESGPPSPTSPTVHHTPPAPELGSEPVRGYRVQGGAGHSSSQGRLVVQPDGSLTIDGSAMLYINFGQEGRALEFRALREAEGGAVIVEFDVDPAFVQRLRDEAVPQRAVREVGRDLPRPAQQADRRTVPDSFGIPSNMFDDFLAAIVPGSVRIRE